MRLAQALKWVAKAGIVAAVTGAFFLSWPAPGRAQSRHIVVRIPAEQPPAVMATPLSPNFGPVRGVPGFGFDYEHLLAVGPNASRRFGHQGREFGRHGFGQGVLPLIYTGGWEPFYPQAQPSVIVLEQPPPTVVVQPPPSPVRAAEPASPPTASATPPAPLPQVGQFILVRRDGQIVLAIAFTVSGNQVTYITRAGNRLSFPLAKLDVQATQQMNAVNGTRLSLPN